jgi:hypothetical protein
MEKCIKCEKQLGFNKLHVNNHLNEWLCLECEELYLKELEIFNNDFIQPERLNPRDDRNIVCDSPNTTNK